MLISAAPIALPITTANPPTEAVTTETAKKVPIPQPTPSSENPTARQSTDNQEFVRSPFDNTKEAEQSRGQSESNEQQSSEQNQGQESGQQSKSDQQDKKNEQAIEAKQAKEVAQLSATDREVRAHETAHASAGGALAGAPQLSYTTGPDGKRYAVSGEVSIDTSKVTDDPQATIAKMSQVRKAALAPANPSTQDLKVAAIASQIANQAQIELTAELTQKTGTEGSQEQKGSLFFTSPISARRSALQLNQRIADTGALDELP
jgi:hypothetical protein